MVLLWIFVLVVSIAALVKGADWMLDSAEKIGLAIGLSPFIVGVVIVGLGTSFPEFVSSVFAILAGANEIVAANAIGSNIANILLVAGVASVFAGRLAVTKSLIDLDIPLLSAATVLFLGVAWDGSISQMESGLLFLGFLIYLVYTMTHESEERETREEDIETILPNYLSRRKNVLNPFRSFSRLFKKKEDNRPKVSLMDAVMLVIGVASLAFGAKFLIDSVIELSTLIGIGTGAIAMFAVAIGTSLPELLVSIKAALKGKSEVALGNVFGSNVFNLLFVVGVPGMFVMLPLDEQTLALGMPLMILATILFVISGISRRVHSYEGAMYLCIYLFFIGKLFEII